MKLLNKEDICVCSKMTVRKLRSTEVIKSSYKGFMMLDLGKIKSNKTQASYDPAITICPGSHDYICRGPYVHLIWPWG